MSTEYEAPAVSEETEVSPVDAFAEMFEGEAAQDEAQDEAQGEAQDEGVEEEVDETDEPEQSSGPSAEMLAVAKLAGVPEEFLGMAKDNGQLQTLITHFTTQQQKPVEATPEPEATADQADELTVGAFLPEEEFDETDPTHKALAKVVEALNKERKTTRLLVAHASAQLQQQQQAEAQSFQAPYDEALDEFSNDVFGNSAKGLTPTQAKIRESAFNAYLTLVEGEPSERRKELAAAAVKAKFSKIFGDNIDPDVKREALVKQSKKRRGSGGAKASPGHADPEKEFEQVLIAMAAGVK